MSDNRLTDKLPVRRLLSGKMLLLLLTQLGKVLLFLLLRAIGINGVHDQGRLHTHDGAIAAVHSLYFSRNQTIGHIACSSTAITFTANTVKGETVM